MTDIDDYQRFYRLPLPSLPEDEIWRQQRLEKFIYDWDNVPTLANFFGENKNLATCIPLERYMAIGYMFYEQLQSLFCKDVQDVYQLSALVLGEALVAHFEFTWCRSTLYPSERLQIFHEPSNTLLHLPTYITNARNHGHDNIMNELVIDILFKFVRDYRYHWLLFCTQSNWAEDEQLKQFKICPPVELRRQLRLMSWLDEELLLYRLDLEGLTFETYHYPKNTLEQTWENVFTQLDYQFKVFHGEDWHEKALNIAREHGNEPYLDE